MYMKIVLEDSHEDDGRDPYKSLTTSFNQDMEFVTDGYFEALYNIPLWSEVLKDFITVLEKVYGYEIAHKVQIEQPQSWKNAPNWDSFNAALEEATEKLDKKSKSKK